MATALLSVDTDEGNGTLYWVVTQSYAPPTAFQVEGGADENGDAADASGNQSVTSTGTQNAEAPYLTDSVVYYAHFMHKDAAGNRSDVASSAAFTADLLTISGIPVLTATEDAAYDGFTATGSGGKTPYTYSLVGTWPDGLSIDSGTGEVSGTPTENGTFASLSVRVTDDIGQTADLDSFSVVVDPASASDPFFSSVKLLLGFEGADASTTITDESPSARGNATIEGNAQIDTAQFKFGSSSYLSDGSGDGAKFTHSTDFDFTGQFTLEAWIRPNTTTPGNRDILSNTGGTFAIGFLFWCPSSPANQLSFWAGVGSTVSFNQQINSSGLTWVSGQWYHVAVDRDSSDKIRVYRDGTMVASATASGTIGPGGSIRFGVGVDDQGTGSRSWNGWIDEVRVTKGVARYASDSGYTVPTEAFSRS